MQPINLEKAPKWLYSTLENADAKGNGNCKIDTQAEAQTALELCTDKQECGDIKLYLESHQFFLFTTNGTIADPITKAMEFVALANKMDEEAIDKQEVKGVFEKAIETAGKIKDPNYQTGTLIYTIISTADAGLLDTFLPEFTKMIGKIEDPICKLEAIEALIEEALMTGEGDRELVLLNVFEKVENPKYQAQLTIVLAEEAAIPSQQTKAINIFKKAIHIIDSKIKESSDKTELLSLAAAKIEQAVEFPHATRILEQEKAKGILYKAENVVKQSLKIARSTQPNEKLLAGVFLKALETTNNITDVGKKGQALKNILSAIDKTIRTQELWQPYKKFEERLGKGGDLLKTQTKIIAKRNANMALLKNLFKKAKEINNTLITSKDPKASAVWIELNEYISKLATEKQVFSI